MRDLPKASICIPTYNQAQFLRESLRSALNQTFDDYEVVVSENHCTDNSAEILREFSDPHLRVIRPERHLSALDNFELAIKHSHGKYFNFLPSDDVLLPDFLESQVKILDRHPNVVFVHSAAEFIDIHGKTVKLSKSLHHSFIRSGQKEFKRYIFGMRCHGNSLLIRRNAFEAIGGFKPYAAGDWELCLRLLLYGDVAYNEKVLVKYRVWHNTFRRTVRHLEFLKSIAQIYDFYESYALDHSPDLTKTILKARKKMALHIINGLAGCDASIQEEVKKAVSNVSSSPIVKLKLILSDRFGLYPLWQGIYKLESRGKLHIKSLLYPLLTNKRENF